MTSGNASRAATIESTSFNYPHDVPSVGEREPLVSPNTGETVNKLFTLQGLLSDAGDIAQRNTGLLLIVVAQGFFAVVDAIVKILQSIDPPVTPLQVRLNPILAVSQCSDFPQAHGCSNDNHLYGLHDIHVRTLLQIDTSCF